MAKDSVRTVSMEMQVCRLAEFSYQLIRGYDFYYFVGKNQNGLVLISKILLRF